MSSKVILIVLDGLEYNSASQCMGLMNGFREQGKATLYKLTCELPSLSRPLYETILTGICPIDSGIVNNQVNRNSNQTLRDPHEFHVKILDASRSVFVHCVIPSRHCFAVIFKPTDMARFPRYENDKMRLCRILLL